MRKLNCLGSVLTIELVESSLSMSICVKVIIHTVKGFSFSYPYVTHCQEQNPCPRLCSDGIHYILIDRNVCFWYRCQNKSCIMPYLFSWSYDIFSKSISRVKFSQWTGGTYSLFRIIPNFSYLLIFFYIYHYLYDCYYFTDSYLDVNMSR